MTRPKKFSARSLLRAFVGALVVAGFAAFALRSEAPVVGDPLEEHVEPLARELPACDLQAADALAHARALEDSAKARWERVLFSLEEAAHAAQQMAEATACFAAARDRAGRLRAGGLHAAYAGEIERRFVHARLLLRVAIRAQQVDRARVQVATLLALLSCAPASARGFRAELEQLGRSYAAYAYERTTKESEP